MCVCVLDVKIQSCSLEMQRSDLFREDTRGHSSSHMCSHDCRSFPEFDPNSVFQAFFGGGPGGPGGFMFNFGGRGQGLNLWNSAKHTFLPASYFLFSYYLRIFPAYLLVHFVNTVLTLPSLASSTFKQFVYESLLELSPEIL